MNADASEPIAQLHKVLAELEGMAKAAAGVAGEGGADIVERLKGTLSAAQLRIRDAERALERDAVHGAKVADEYVRDHAWLSIGVAAAVAFLLGALTARRE